MGSIVSHSTPWSAATAWSSRKCRRYRATATTGSSGDADPICIAKRAIFFDSSPTRSSSSPARATALAFFALLEEAGAAVPHLAAAGAGPAGGRNDLASAAAGGAGGHSLHLS